MMEFHIPFCALRSSETKIQQETGRRPFRRSRNLPLPRDQSSAEQDCAYHEAQISFLLTGIDEWFWMSYCLVDTYFGSGLERANYLDEDNLIDPASSSIWLMYPTWNPREYFLRVLNRRMMQATGEWTTLIKTFEDRLVAYVSRTLHHRGKDFGI
jgi:hypothetical protein